MYFSLCDKNVPENYSIHSRDKRRNIFIVYIYISPAKGFKLQELIYNTTLSRDFSKLLKSCRVHLRFRRYMICDGEPLSHVIQHNEKINSYNVV